MKNIYHLNVSYVTGDHYEALKLQTASRSQLPHEEDF